MRVDAGPSVQGGSSGAEANNAHLSTRNRMALRANSYAFAFNPDSAGRKGELRRQFLYID